ncbi:hypothetical protein COCNU_04G011680 [Cocos nucifera]|uniref:Uncharacterized protein n=1 Tax=Cocos nucifera TaxID=13894 RepID=A0A8K0I729_COCNU|nr:hypothetical protein COCNU_04G011680 [Cocos nucifera]
MRGMAPVSVPSLRDVKVLDGIEIRSPVIFVGAESDGRRIELESRKKRSPLIIRSWWWWLRQNPPTIKSTLLANRNGVLRKELSRIFGKEKRT